MPRAQAHDRRSRYEQQRRGAVGDDRRAARLVEQQPSLADDVASAQPSQQRRGAVDLAVRAQHAVLNDEQAVGRRALLHNGLAVGERALVAVAQELADHRPRQMAERGMQAQGALQPPGPALLREQRPERRVCRDEAPQHAGVQARERQRLGGPDGRAASRAVEHTLLAERLALTDQIERHLLPLRAGGDHAGAPGEHDEERIRPIALAHHHAAELVVLGDERRQHQRAEIRRDRLQHGQVSQRPRNRLLSRGHASSPFPRRSDVAARRRPRRRSAAARRRRRRAARVRE